MVNSIIYLDFVLFMEVLMFAVICKIMMNVTYLAFKLIVSARKMCFVILGGLFKIHPRNPS